MARTPKRIFWSATGINNVSDPVRIGFDWRKGIQDLAWGTNIDLDDTGRPSRRKGTYRQAAGSWTSLFDCGPYAIGVAGSLLYVIDPDYSRTAIRNVTPGARLRACLADGKAFYVNGHEIGFVRNRTSYVWTVGDYIGPTTQRTFTAPPTGHLVAFYNGRIYVAEENVLWYSEPFAYGWFDRARNYIKFNSRLRMLAPVDDGLYVSSDRQTYFLHGAGPQDFGRRRVDHQPAIEGTEVAVDGRQLPSLQQDGTCQIWASAAGILVGANSGRVRNITDGRLTYPTARYGAGGIVNGRYVCCLEP